MRRFSHCVFVFLCFSVLSATNWTVNTLSDALAGSGETGSLRFCLFHAAMGDFIEFEPVLSGTINIGFVENTALPVLIGVTITGHTHSDGTNKVTLSGQDTYPIFIALSGSNSISNLTLAHGKGVGGNGGSGEGGGGGGMGAGGGLFICPSAAVMLTNAPFLNCSVAGGNGGSRNNNPSLIGQLGGGGGGGSYGSTGGSSTFINKFGSGGGGGGVCNSAGGDGGLGSGGGGGTHKSPGGSGVVGLSECGSGGGGGIFYCPGGTGVRFSSGGGGGVDHAPGGSAPSSNNSRGGAGGGGIGTAGGAPTGSVTGGTGGGPAGSGGAGGDGSASNANPGMPGGATGGGGGGGDSSTANGGTGGNATLGGGGGGGVGNSSGSAGGNSMEQGGGGGGGLAIHDNGGNGGSANFGGGGGGGQSQFLTHPGGSGGPSALLGGGGGASTCATGANVGGTGGIGGGGGGAGGVTGASGGISTPGNSIFGGGTGGAMGATGGGGSAFGGAVFISNNAFLTMQNGAVSGNMVGSPGMGSPSGATGGDGFYLMDMTTALTFSVTADNTLTIPNNFAGKGVVRKLEAGTLKLTADNGPFLGSTIIEDGNLILTGVLENEVKVFSGALSGTGSITGTSNPPLTNGILENGLTGQPGTVSPGDPTGVLTVDGSYTQIDGSNLLIHALNATAPNWGQLVVVGPASIAGKLTLNCPEEASFNDGETIVVLDSAALTGMFTTFDPGILPSGVTATHHYNTTQVYILFTIVISPPIDLKVQCVNNFKLMFANVITGKPPLTGLRPTSYNIYSDPDLTNLIGTAPATPNGFRFVDKNRCKCSNKTYYITSVNGMNESFAATVTGGARRCP